MNQENIPILEVLEKFTNQNPLSFHVPGHKNGAIFPEQAKSYFQSLLPLDTTELPGLDDLHAPHGAIADAERLAAEYFQSDHTFFLINGSTAGNLAMILAAAGPGDKVLVQRNSHKSIMNGIELAGAQPIFLAPAYEKSVQRFTNPAPETIEQALINHPDAKALILTYPDYFGQIYDIKKIIRQAHAQQIPVLVDEAHGVHFSLGAPFPVSSLAIGADVVVHSAHKTAPAMTMASYLHMKSELIQKEDLAYRLQMIQSSSPSYPLMASLDIARYFLAAQTKETIEKICESTKNIKSLFQASDKWELIPSDDPLKITLQPVQDYAAGDIAALFEQEGVYPELTTERQILFIHGLAPFTEWERLKKVIQTVNESLKITANHATIEVMNVFTNDVQELALSYTEMQSLVQQLVPLEESIGKIAAEPVIPYPPGIPLVLKGEKITLEHIEAIRQLTRQGVRIQERAEGIRIFSRKLKGAET
jgi:lysine decarboxylase